MLGQYCFTQELVKTRKFFNTSGKLYREQKLATKLPMMSEEEMYALLATNGMLVKRPLLITEDQVLIGFNDQKWQDALLWLTKIFPGFQKFKFPGFLIVINITGPSRLTFRV